MNDVRQQMEAELAQKPFDFELRTTYANHLFDSDAFQDALVQYELLADQSKEAHPLISSARCLLKLDRTQEAIDRYDAARVREGFEAVDALEHIRAARIGRPAFRTVEGGLGEVIHFRRPTDDRIKFGDVAGMDALKKTLRIQIIEPFLRPGLFRRFRKDAGGGVLLYGPPGCGKTMMARAVAGECDASFLSVGISDVLNMWIGESERNLGECFEKARANPPCVMFFDELDALAYSRSKASSEHTRTVVNEFLAQLDGFDKDNRSMLVLAATNMPWDVDDAIKRPGRLSRQIFVPPPDVNARSEMFRLKLSGIPTGEIDVAALARATEFFSGADIDGVVDAAKESVISDIIESGNERPMQSQDLLMAVEDTSPTTTAWLKTARNLVRYGETDASYREVGTYLKKSRFR